MRKLDMNKVDVIDLTKALMNAVKDITDNIGLKFESRMMTSLINDREILYNDYNGFSCYTNLVRIEGTNKTRINSNIYVPFDNNVANSDQGKFMLNYVNELYDLDLDKDSRSDYCIFSILHEIGHYLDYALHCRKGFNKASEYMIENNTALDNLNKETDEELAQYTDDKDKQQAIYNNWRSYRELEVEHNADETASFFIKYYADTLDSYLTTLA